METNKVQVDFANFNYTYGEFQQQYKEKCEKISRMPRKSFSLITDNPIKIITALFFEYLVYIKSEDVKEYITSSILELEEKTSTDEEYRKLSKKKNMTALELSKYNKIYFKYIIELYTIVGSYSDELTTTFMPNKSDRKKILKYTNTNEFFQQFTQYKSNTSKAIAEFSIFKFRDKFTYFLGFYFAYYLFIDSQTRVYCEEVIEKIINIYTDEDISKILIDGYSNISNDKKNQIRDIDRIFHKSIISIFLKCNISYSNYGVIPKLVDKITFDDTLI